MTQFIEHSRCKMKDSSKKVPKTYYLKPTTENGQPRTDNRERTTDNRERTTISDKRQIDLR